MLIQGDIFYELKINFWHLVIVGQFVNFQYFEISEFGQFDGFQCTIKFSSFLFRNLLINFYFFV